MQSMGSPTGNTGQRADMVSAGYLCTRDKDRELSAGGRDKQLPMQPRNSPGSASGAALCTHTLERVGFILKKALAEPLSQDPAKTTQSKDSLLSGNILHVQTPCLSLW